MMNMQNMMRQAQKLQKQMQLASLLENLLKSSLL